MEMGPLSWAVAAPPSSPPAPTADPDLGASFPQLLHLLWPDLVQPYVGPGLQIQTGPEGLSALPNQGKQPCTCPVPALTPKVRLLAEGVRGDIFW